jgi:hypothetical protein
MTAMRMVWLGLAVIGVILPWTYFAQWFWANGLDMAGMVEAWNANDASTGLVYDLTVTYAALIVWILTECLPRRDWLGLVAIPAGILVGVSFALPLYLFLRSRPDAER